MFISIMFWEGETYDHRDNVVMDSGLYIIMIVIIIGGTLDFVWEQYITITKMYDRGQYDIMAIM